MLPGRRKALLRDERSNASHWVTQHARVQKRITKQARAERRAKAHPRAVGPTAAEQASLGAQTRRLYATAYTKFLEWAGQKPGARPTTAGEVLDNTLVTYIDELFRQGEDANNARFTLFGVIFFMNLGKGGSVLPRCRRALRGFVKDTPPLSNYPIPIENMAVLAKWLFDSGELQALLAGLALVCSFDLFLRPSEALAIKSADVVAPQRGRYKNVAVIIAPAPLVEARTTWQAKKAAKSGEWDDTVIAGLPGLHLEWVSEVLLKLGRVAADLPNIFSPLGLPTYERLVRKACDATGAGPATPHSVRHGGPSLAVFNKVLTLAEVQKRGRWLQPRSVRRYEKSGKLTRRVAATPRHIIASGAQLLHTDLRAAALSAVLQVHSLRVSFGTGKSKAHPPTPLRKTS